MDRRKKILLGLVASSILLGGCNKEKETLNNIESEDSLVVENTTQSQELNTDEEVNKDESEDDFIKENESNNTEDKKENNKNENPIKNNNSTKEDKTDISNQEDNITLVENPIFKKSDIDESIKSRMNGKSMPTDSTISYDELSYLTITYLDYNGQTKQGEMVVHKKLADEVLDIFKDIYFAKFPIERMRLVDDYNASDHQSMVNNNSSAFCYRTIAGTNKVSNHGKGVAIDINPFYNPHVLKSSGTVNPPEASKYANRSLNEKGMIKYNDVVYKAFTSRGWTWGGNWNNPDYQHFEKQI